MSKNVVFFGTPVIAVSCLRALLDEQINVVGVVTQPDRPIGRKQLIEESDVKAYASLKKLKIFQPEKLDSIYHELCNLKPDLFIVCAYGNLISEKILNIPQYHCVNIHTSLLPRWRGGAPIHYAVLNQDKESGVTLMYMTKELDAGDIIHQEMILLTERETYQSLYQRLSDLAYVVLRKHIHRLFNTYLEVKKQDINLVTWAGNISREQEKIDWTHYANEIDAHIRALYDKPMAYTTYQGQNVKILEAKLIDITSEENPGCIVKIDHEGIYVVCGDHKVIVLQRIQIAGKNATYVKNILNGKHIFVVNKFFV